MGNCCSKDESLLNDTDGNVVIKEKTAEPDMLLDFGLNNSGIKKRVSI